MGLHGVLQKSVVTLPWYKLPIFSAFLSFVLLGVLSVIVVQKILQAASSEMRLEMDYWAQAFAIRLEGQLGANLAVGYGLEAQVSVLEKLEQAELEIVAQRLLNKPLNIRNIALAPDLIVNAVYPLESNRAALGLNYRLHENQRAQVLRAMESNQVILAGPLDLVQGGGKHLIARFPVRRLDDSEWGVISLVIDCESLLRDVGLHEIEQKYRMAVRSENGLRHIVGDMAVFDRTVQRHLVELPGTAWQIAMEPLNDKALILRQAMGWVAAFIGSLLASTAVFYLRRYKIGRAHV